MTHPYLTRIERYLDAVPRSEAAALPVGAFTLFVAHAHGAGSYYARPTLVLSVRRGAVRSTPPTSTICGRSAPSLGCH